MGHEEPQTALRPSRIRLRAHSVRERTFTGAVECPIQSERFRRRRKKRMSPSLIARLVLTAALLATGPALAQPESDAWQVRVNAGAVTQWASDLDSGGDMSADTWAVEIGASRTVTPTLRAGLTVGYSERNFDFSDDALGGAGWSGVRDVAVSARINWKADPRWNLFAVPTAHWAAEQGAALDDGLTGGLLAAASYRVNDRLSIGPGFGVFSELEDEVDWFPILAIDWRITDELTLQTGGGFAASRGPGLTLRWSPSERWSFAIAGRYEKRRFRLDGDGPTADGIGQETSWPLYLSATRNFGRQASFSIIGGTALGGDLRLEDDDGVLLEATDYETAPFAGATFDFRF
jgi:hypothetical protein